MLFALDKLLYDHQAPVCVKRDQKISDALAIMISNDFSQLPVVDEHGELTGIISEKSIAQAYFHQRAAVSLLDLTVDHCQEPAILLPIDVDLFVALDRLKDTYAIVVVKDNKPYRILTDYDTTHFFRDLSEGLILVEDIEVTLRQSIEVAFPDDSAKQAGLMRAFGADRRDPTKPSRDYERLSFGEHVQFITSEENWPRFRGVFEPRSLFISFMDQVRQIRNQLAHFRGRIDPVQRSALVQSINWLASRPRLRFANDRDSQTVRVSDKDIPSQQPTDKYVSLEHFLAKSTKPGKPINVSFDDIERLLGEQLPQTALAHRSWWENDHTENATAMAWLRAGCLVSDVDLAARQVTFRSTEHALMQLFFYDVLERLKLARPGITRATKAYAQNWWNFSAGRSGFVFAWTFPKGNKIRVEFYIDLGDATETKEAFDKLEAQRDAIEREIGLPLDWQRLENRRASRISVARPVEISGPPEQLEEAKRWTVEYTLKFVDAFQPRIKSL